MNLHVSQIEEMLNDMLADVVNRGGKASGIETFVCMIHPDTINSIAWNGNANPKKLLGIMVRESTHVPVGQIECHCLVGRMIIH